MLVDGQRLDTLRLLQPEETADVGTRQRPQGQATRFVSGGTGMRRVAGVSLLSLLLISMTLASASSGAVGGPTDAKLATFPARLPPAFAGGSQAGGAVSFRWAFASRRSADGELASITKDVTLETGNSLKMMVEILQDCFVYVILHDSAGDVQVLFQGFEPGSRHFIPEGADWFVLGGADGEETLYLLASAERLTDLETVVGQYAAASQDARPQLAQEIIGQITELRRLHFMPGTVAERPAMIAGQTRGLRRGTEVTDFATEISAPTFFSRTFVIDHR